MMLDALLSLSERNDGQIPRSEPWRPVSPRPGTLGATSNGPHEAPSVPGRVESGRPSLLGGPRNPTSKPEDPIRTCPLPFTPFHVQPCGPSPAPVPAKGGAAMFDDAIWPYCVRKTDQWGRGDYSPPTWWLYVTEPVGRFCHHQLDRLERKPARELDGWGR
jgi:hypothetical protein